MREEMKFQIPESGKTKHILDFSGADAEGKRYTADSLSLLYDGKRILPILGEFHYSRWERESWEEELLKIRAGGLTGVQSYVFWNHHEEKKNEWDFSGRRDLRAFVTLCGELGLRVWLRIGPWCHGECRHGGFPDYIQYADYPVRTNSPEYLSDVRRLYGKIGEQIRGLYVKDGGPIFGVQIENEYGHCGGPEDPEERRRHVEMLKKIALDCGIEVPYYSETGWGGTSTEQTMPVLGGYVDAPWQTDDREMPASKNFLFGSYRVDTNIASDWKPEQEETEIDAEQFPYLLAELGGGLQVTSHRRPVASALDTESQMLTMLGSGANMLGYYMYHGGINPEGKYTSLNEAQTIGGYTTLPVKSYDFEAPINEAGRRNLSYGKLKKHHWLLKRFAEEMAGAEPLLPDRLPKDEEDTETLRAALRFNYEKGCGFLFWNTHLRHRKMAAHSPVVFTLSLRGETVVFPPVELPEEASGILPFRLRIGRYFLKYANVEPLCTIGERVIFFGDPEKAVIVWEGEEPPVTVLTREEADRAFLLSDGLYITEDPGSCLLEKNVLTTEGRFPVGRYLLTEKTSEKLRIVRENGEEERNCTSYSHESAARLALLSEKEQDGKVLYRDYQILLTIPEDRKNTDQCYLRISFDGDRAEVFQDGRLSDDWYQTGAPWYLQLGRLGYPAELTLRVHASDARIPCSWTDGVYYELPVNEGCCLKTAEVIREYRICLSHIDCPAVNPGQV